MTPTELLDQLLATPVTNFSPEVRAQRAEFLDLLATAVRRLDLERPDLEDLLATAVYLPSLREQP